MKKILLLTLGLVYSNAFAMFCPDNFNQINYGDPIDQVLLQCGKPVSQKSYKSTSNEPQEWNYYVRMVPNMQGSLRMTVAFNQGKVINISVNGAGVTNTAICGNAITLGQTLKQVEAICGKPVFINQGSTQQGTQNPAQADDMTELTYASATLVFEKGKLTERK